MINEGEKLMRAEREMRVVKGMFLGSKCWGNGRRMNYYIWEQKLGKGSSIKEYEVKDR